VFNIFEDIRRKPKEKQKKSKNSLPGTRFGNNGISLIKSNTTIADSFIVWTRARRKTFLYEHDIDTNYNIKRKQSKIIKNDHFNGQPKAKLKLYNCNA